MAVTADSVVIELLAKTDGYTSNINGAATATTNAMSKIEQSATRAENQIVRSTGAIANAQRNLGRQIADVGTQLSGGQSPFLIIAQQAPQVADALADMGGRGARVAQFFAGPWGAALLAAGSALGLLLEQVMRTGEGVDALVRKLQEAAEKTRLTAEAQRIFETTAEGAADAVDKMNDSLGNLPRHLRHSPGVRRGSGDQPGGRRRAVRHRRQHGTERPSALVPDGAQRPERWREALSRHR